MTTPHPYAHVLRAISDGETIQIRDPGGRWVDQPANKVLEMIGAGTYEQQGIRVKPRHATHTPGRLRAQRPHDGPCGLELADEATGLHQVCQDVTEANARRLVACWNACDGMRVDHIEKLAAIGHGVASLINDVLSERDALLAAVQAYERAHESLFTQCASNTVRNVWGREVDMTWLNQAHELACHTLRAITQPQNTQP